MKIFKIISAGLVLSSSLSAYADTSGYLLLKINKYSYTNSQNPQNNQHSQQIQKYKILIDPSFLSQFKKQPSPTSSGTQFYCGMSDGDSTKIPSLIFTQWFGPKADGRLATWFWGEGSESVNGNTIQAHNGKAQVNITFPSWQTIDSSEMLSFESDDAQNINGLNVGISAKFVAADDVSLKDALLAPLKGGDGTVIVPGDSQTGLSLTAICSFQNN